MRKILFPLDAVYHTLTHFETLDANLRQQLCNAKYDEDEINAQLLRPGSKFFASFAQSPQEVVERLLQLFPETFATMLAGQDGKYRLSFCLDGPVGTAGVVVESILTDAERATIREEMRNGCMIRTVQITRMITTSECQLILAEGKSCEYLCTIFPGELAPPLPRPGEIPDTYWNTHLFIDNRM